MKKAKQIWLAAVVVAALVSAVTGVGTAAADDKAHARKRYEELLRRFPESREGTMARISLGRLELDDFSRPKVALRYFDAYLAGSGKRALAGEALVGRARALQTLGRAQDERQTWQTLLDEHPSSAHVERARRRLEVLD